MYTLFHTEFDLGESILPKRWIPNEYFTHRLDKDHVLLTTSYRAWIILNNDEYMQLKQGRIENNPFLFRVLENLGIILTERNSHKISRMFCERYLFLMTPPPLFIIVPTIRCNLACIYCGVQAICSDDTKKYDMDEEILRKAIDWLLGVPMVIGRKRFVLEFQGGECLLRFDLMEKIMDYATEQAAKRGISTYFKMVSNFTLMTDTIAENLKRRGNVGIASSLDGPREVHNANRRFAFTGQGTYDVVTYWVRRLREKYQLQVGLMPTCTIHLLGHGRELVDEYVNLGIRRIYLRPVNKIGRAVGIFDKIGLSADQFVELWKEVFEYCLELSKQQSKPVIEVHSTYLLMNLLEGRASYMCLRRPCGAGVSQICIDHQGDIYACDAARAIDMLKLGNVTQDSYDAIFTSEKARLLRTLCPEVLPDPDSFKPFSPYAAHCVARAINEHGSPVALGPLSFNTQVYQKMIPYLFHKLMNRQDAQLLYRWVRCLVGPLAPAQPCESPSAEIQAPTSRSNSITELQPG